MDQNSTYNFQRVAVGKEQELERLRAQTLMGWAKEFQNLQRFGLRDGMKILEVGCGPGFVTEQLATSLPDAEVTAVDIDQTLLDHAQNLLHPHTSRVRFIEASVFETGLPDGVFDFAIARLLFLHLPNPVRAAREIFRVLKSGGKLVIVDVDDGLFGVTEPQITQLPTIAAKVARRQAERGGNRLIGRSLPRLLAAAGFENVDMDAVVHHSDLHGIDGFKHQFNAQRFAGFVKSGVITQAEYDELADFSTKLGDPDTYAMMLFFMACGTKPL